MLKTNGHDSRACGINRLDFVPLKVGAWQLVVILLPEILVLPSDCSSASQQPLSTSTIWANLFNPVLINPGEECHYVTINVLFNPPLYQLASCRPQFCTILSKQGQHSSTVSHQTSYKYNTSLVFNSAGHYQGQMFTAGTITVLSMSGVICSQHSGLRGWWKI